MSKFGPFFYFWSDLPNFWYVSYRLIGKHYFIFFFTGFLFFLRNNVCRKRCVSKQLSLQLFVEGESFNLLNLFSLSNY